MDNTEHNKKLPRLIVAKQYINQKIWWSAIRHRIRDGLFEKLGLGLFSILIALFGLKLKIVGNSEIYINKISEPALIYSFLFLLIFFMVWYLMQLIFFVVAPSEIQENINVSAYVKAYTDLYADKTDDLYAKATNLWYRCEEYHLYWRVICGIFQVIGFLSFFSASLILLLAVFRLSLELPPLL